MPDNSSSDDARGSDALEQLGRISLRDHSMESLLRAVADLSKTALAADGETSIFVQSPGRRTTVVSTGQLALDLDEVQYQDEQGPCLRAAARLEMVHVPDTLSDQRWPDYARRAAEHGNRSSLSVPLPIDDRRSEALNIYARHPLAFDATAHETAQKFGTYATVALANMHAYEDARSMASNLQVALESRAVIDQAKGILIERHRSTADQGSRSW